MSPARYGENMKLIRRLSHELYKKVLNVFSPILPYIETILSTSECSYGYKQDTEMGIVS